MSRIYLDGCILLDCFPAIKIGGSKILLDIQPSFFLKERLIDNHCSLKEFSFWEPLLKIFIYTTHLVLIECNLCKNMYDALKRNSGVSADEELKNSISRSKASFHFPFISLYTMYVIFCFKRYMIVIQNFHS